MKVFVIGCDNAAVALWIIRSLGRKGINVTFGCDSKKKIACYSKYIKKRILFDDFRLFPYKFIESFLSELKKEKYDLVIPINDAVIVPIMLNIDQCIQFSRIAVPEMTAYHKVYDKIQSYELAEQLGIPTPEHKTVVNQEDIYTDFFNYKYPIVIKPSRSKVFKNEIIENLNVEFAHSREEFENKCCRLLQYGPVSVQALVQGDIIGQSFLLKDGNPLAYFQYQRVHQPEFGGGSSYRKSVSVDDNILQHSLSFLKAVKWNGVAMAEYIVGTDKIPYFMEINGRFWGSLPLPIFAGIDFPWLLVKMYQNDSFDIPVKSYKTNVYVRNFQKDHQHVRGALRNKKITGQFGQRMSFYTMFKHYFRILNSNEHIDEFYIKDVKPFLIVLIRMAKSFFRSLWRRISDVFNGIAINGIRLIYNRGNFRLKKRQELKVKLNQDGISILFVCKGNICRSPFADKLLPLILTSGTNISISSCGLSVKDNNQMDEDAIEIAKLFKVTLREHEQYKISLSLVNSADIILVFEPSHALSIISLFPRSRKKIYLLGVMDDEPIDIVDPFNKGKGKFKEVYKRIDKCLRKAFEVNL